MTPIYRFIPFYQLVDIVQREALTLVHSSLWDDGCENPLFRAAADERYAQRIFDAMKHNANGEFFHSTMRAHYELLHGQSWTICAESDALWRAYGYNNLALRIESTREYFENYNKTQSRNIGLDIITIEYDDFTLQGLIDDIRLTENSIDFGGKAFTIKRPAFAHEQEVRLITLRTDQSQWKEADEDFYATIKAHSEHNEEMRAVLNSLENEKKSCSKDPNISYIPIELHDCIKSVLVHPLAPPHYCETVEAFCKSQGISFMGKSALYEFKLD